MAPRPFLVPPKTPLMRRTGTKVVLVLMGWALVFGVLVMADAQSDADRRRQEISEFTSLVENQLYQGGVAQQSFAGPLVLPQLGEALSQLQAGQGNEAELGENTASWAAVAAGGRGRRDGGTEPDRAPGDHRGADGHGGHDLRHGVRRPPGGAPAGRPPDLGRPSRWPPRRLRQPPPDP